MWVPHPRTIAPLLREFMLSWLAGKQTCYLLLLELFILKPPIFLSFLLILAVLAKQRWRLFHEKESPWILPWYKVHNKIKKGNTIFSKCTRWQIGSNFFSWNYDMTSCPLGIVKNLIDGPLTLMEEKLLVIDVISNGFCNGTSTASLLSLLSLPKLINSSRPFPSGSISVRNTKWMYCISHLIKYTCVLLYRKQSV